MPEHFTTWVAVSRQAIKHNIRQLKHVLSPQTQLMAVVKSNAYGHGLAGVAKICRSAGVKWFGTVNLAEALELRRAGIQGRILVMSFFDPDKLAIAIKQNITLTVYNLPAALAINRLAKKLHKKVPIHLKLDTGTTRLGFLPADCVRAAKTIAKLPNIRIEGVFSHFADAEVPSQYSTNRQLHIFKKTIAQLTEQGIRIPFPHIACAAAAILNRQTHFAIARVGIALYGLWSIEDNGAHLSKLALRPALSWHTRVLQVKTVPTGTHIGYGGTYCTSRPTTIAILPVGYWDGYDRKLSNNGEVLIHGHRCPIRGRICMNLMMVDVTKVKSVRPGDRATLIGRDERQAITADDLAKRIGTINYEVVTRINPVLPRLFI